MHSVRAVPLPRMDSECSVPIVRFHSLGAGAPVAILTLAGAGDMSPFTGEGAANRARLCRSFGIEPSQVAFLRQIHSRTVVAAADLRQDAAGTGEVREGDGLIARGDDRVLSVTVADCMPVYLFDAGSGAYALLHSGWRGTGIAGEALSMLAQLHGTRPENVSAILGPSIGSCCYRVDEDRARRFAAEWGTAAVVHRNSTAYLDLRAANIGLLERRGVRDIIVTEACTACSGRLGSYRRQGADGYTRMAALFGYFPE